MSRSLSCFPLLMHLKPQRGNIPYMEVSATETTPLLFKPVCGANSNCSLQTAYELSSCSEVQWKYKKAYFKPSLMQSCCSWAKSIYLLKLKWSLLQKLFVRLFSYMLISCYPGCVCGSCDSGVTNQGSSAATRKIQSGSDRWAPRRHFHTYQTVK